MTLLYSNKKDTSLIVYRSAGVYSTADRTVEAHDGSHGTVDFLCGFFLVCFDVSGRVCTDENVVHHPAQYRMTAVSDFCSKVSLISSLVGGDISLKP